MAALYQALFANGFETFIHFVLALGSFSLASAVFDFRKIPKWINWAACIIIGVEAVIFLLQGLSHLVQNDALTYLAYRILGQSLEARLVDLFVLWCVAVLLFDSQGKTRLFGFVAVSIAICSEIYKYSLAYMGETPPEALKLSILLLFVWLLFESIKKIPLEMKSANGIDDESTAAAQ